MAYLFKNPGAPVKISRVLLKQLVFRLILNLKTLKGKIRQYSWSISAGYQLSS
jgi:hypothetical protein